MSELIPEGLPRGKDIVAEGRKLGEAVELGVSAFCREKQVRSVTDYKRMRAEKGLITWHMIMGLSSLEEQVAATRDIYEWGQKTGVEIDIGQIIPDTRMALLPEMWDKVPRGTSFMLDGVEDYIKIAQTAPIQLVCADSHIGSPASVRNTVNALRAGTGFVGTFAKFVYTYPYWRDDVAQVVETIKSVGVMAAKAKDNIITHSYTGSGTPGLLMDVASRVGYARLEKYIVEELCGAKYSIGFGGLASNIPIKIATWLALHDILKGDHPGVTFVYGNTIDVTEHAGSNYAITMAELVPFIVTEQIYKTGAAMLLVPAEEKTRVPNKEEIKDIFMVGEIAKAKAKDYTKMLDFTEINKTRALLVDKGNRFFENVKKGLPEMGVDITDPVQIILAIRRLGAARFEELFHSGEKNSLLPNGISPFIATELMQMTTYARDEAMKKVRAEKLTDVVRGKKFVVGSTDWHAFALYVIRSILEELGARVVSGGVDMDPEEILGMADKEASPYVVMTTHNGLCLDYGRHLMKLVEQRNQPVKVFMGGRLNAIVEGGTEPVDVSDHLSKLGITPCQEMRDLIREIATMPEA